MSTGTAGILIFDEPVFGIRSVEVGFDLAFRAVVILTTEDSDGSNLALVGTGKYESLIRYRGVSAGVNIPKYGSHNFSSLASDTWNDLEGRGSSDRPTCVGTGVYVFTRQTADERNELRWKFLPCGERYERERRPVPVIYFHLRKRVGIEVLTEMNYWELSMRVPGYDVELTEESV